MMPYISGRLRTATNTNNGIGSSGGANAAIGYDTILTTTNVTATTQTAWYPVTNLANTITSSLWRSTGTGTEYITITNANGGGVDYLAIARHNIGTIGAKISVEGDSGSGFVEVAAEIIPADDDVIWFDIPALGVIYSSIRLKIVSSGTTPPQIGILSAGRALYLQRNIYVGHGPVHLNRSGIYYNAIALSGDFLGRVETGSSTKTSVAVDNLEPRWFRSEMLPFFEHARTKPFFWRWRPSDYQSEVSYVMMEGTPRSENILANGFMAVSFNIRGL